MRALGWILIFWVQVGLASANDLTYKIHFDPSTNPDVLEITLTFPVKGYKNTFLMLPNQFGGNEALYKKIKIIDVKNAKQKALEKPYAVELIEMNQKQLVEVRYQVQTSSANDPQTLFDARAPIINQNYVHAIGNGFFIIPYHLKDKEMAVKLEYDFPKSWQFATSFGMQQSTQSVKTGFQNLLNFLIIAGDYRYESFEVNNNQVVVAIQGDWRFSDDAMHQTIVDIVTTVRDFWQDHSDPYYLVAVIPVRGTKRVQAGLGLTNAFSAHLSTKQVLSAELKILLTHEHLHRWLTPKVISDSTDFQEQSYWFTEGFTDYYATLLALRAGIITLNDYVRYFNRTLEEYLFSRAINIPNVKIKEKFWTDYDVGKISYQRGFLLANHWNWQLKDKTDHEMNLDPWFRTLIQNYHQKGEFVTHERMIKQMKSMTSAMDIEKDLKHYVIAGKRIPVAGGSLGKCVKLNKKMVYVTETGFDPKSSLVIGKITGVIKDDIAYKASLRNGQVVQQIHFDPDDYSKAVLVKIKSKEGVKTIKYQGRKGPTKEISRFYIDAEQAAYDPGMCLQWFGNVTPPTLDLDS